jgi:hypothetical protein
MTTKTIKSNTAKAAGKTDVEGRAKQARSATKQAGSATTRAVQQPAAKLAGMLPGSLGKLLLMVITMITRRPAAMIGGLAAALVVLGIVLRRNRS